MRVAFEHRPVHKGTGVAFVGVAQHIFLIALGPCGKAPLHPCRESGAAAAAQARCLDHIDYLLRRHFGQYLAQCPVSVKRYVFVDFLGVDQSAVAQHDTFLLLIEIGFIERLDAAFLNGFLIQKAFYHTAFQKMLFHDFRNILHLYAAVKTSFRIYDHDRAQCTKAKTTRHNNLYFFFQSLCFYFSIHCINNLNRT
ncbi:hypothetical protein SDC9_159159 [bioreactor metagenome]|uniref:Uncharacterized protein n=1 Tax=bioreactor metagenome TaxID=1076179 RepID=A0A645FC12_9ZZZZ